MRVRMAMARRAAAAALLTVAMGAGGAWADQGTVKVANDEKLGKYLTDDQGMTLYVFKQDSPGKSACAGPCAEAWPIYHAEKVDASGGLAASDFGTITREDGKKQTTYKGMPLYYWVKDSKPGETTGHGVKDVWFVATP